MSVLQCLGVGTVAADKETDTDIIQVTLPKDFPSQDGETTANADEVDATYNTQSGDIKQNKVLMSNTVPAKWMPLNTNRITSPDVRQGTKVAVYQYVNTNKYLWTLEGLDGTMRLETVVYAYSASPDISENTPITPDNFYILSISSHKKKIELITGQGNGEACGYQFTIDMGEGYFGTMDSFGQIFMNNAVESSLTYLNKFKSQLSVNKKDFALLNDGNTVIDTKESIQIHSKNISIVADEALNMKATTGEFIFSNTLKVNVGTTYDLTVGNKFSINTPLAAFSALVNVGTTMNAGTSMVSPSMVAGGIEMVGHIHGGVRGGDTTTLGPQSGGKSKMFNTNIVISDEDKSPVTL